MDMLLGHVGGLGSHNLFVYCNNMPTLLVDTNGALPENANKNNIYVYKAFDGVYYKKYYTRDAHPANINSKTAKVITKAIDVAVIVIPFAREAIALHALKGAAGLNSAKQLAGKSAKAIRDIAVQDGKRAFKKTTAVTAADVGLTLFDTSIGEIIVGGAVSAYNVFDESTSGWCTARILNPAVELDPSACIGEIIYMCEPPLITTLVPTSTATPPVAPMPGPAPATIY